MAENRPDVPIPTSLQQLTPEERSVLLECRRNALYYRGFPIGVITALFTNSIIKWYVTPAYRKRISPVGTAVGFIGGMLFGISTYSGTCLKKILALENSPLADSLREGMENIAQQRHEKDPSDQYVEQLLQPSESSAFEKEYSVPDQESWKNPIPGSKIYESDQSVRNQNNLIWDTSEGEVEEPPKKGISYEELRQRHRPSQQQQYQPYSRQQMPKPPVPKPQVDTGNQNDLIWDMSEGKVEEPPKKGITYEELRQRHRASQQQQYQPYSRQKMPKPPAPKPKEDQDHWEGDTGTPDKWEEVQPTQGRQRRNQYGDLIE